MMTIANTSNAVIFLAIFVQHSVEWGANQGHFTAVESEDVSNEKISIEKFSTASELTCSQKCLWLDECFFTKYDTDEGSCELLQKINHDDFDSRALLTKKEKLQRKVNNSRIFFDPYKNLLHHYSKNQNIWKAHCKGN